MKNKGATRIKMKEKQSKLDVPHIKEEAIKRLAPVKVKPVLLDGQG
jgi:hypothetical protein